MLASENYKEVLCWHQPDVWLKQLKVSFFCLKTYFSKYKYIGENKHWL